MKLRATVVSCLVLASLGTLYTPAHAFRMIRNGNLTQSQGVFPVAAQCSEGNFTHWTIRGLVWRINPVLQGATAGAGVDYAMNQWNSVSGSDYRLARGASTNAGIAVDGNNTMLWGAGIGCGGNCLAYTALTVRAVAPGQTGQELIEADTTFNSYMNWTTSNTNYDIRGVAAHELGVSLGIANSEVSITLHRPTMRAAYFDDQRTLENDDKDALRCSVNTYPVNCTQPCPSGGVYDGANCYLWTVLGVNRFLYEENMYYQASANPNNRCPQIAFNSLNNTTFQPWFDNASCVVRLSTRGNQVPFLWADSYYLTPVCRP